MWSILESDKKQPQTPSLANFSYVENGKFAK